MHFFCLRCYFMYRHQTLHWLLIFSQQLDTYMYVRINCRILLYGYNVSLRASSPFGGYREKYTRERHARRDATAGGQACYQSTLISGTSFFSQWYFPLSGRSTNENLKGMVASSPFAGPSRLRRSLARSRAVRFARPNRRACSQATTMLI